MADELYQTGVVEEESVFPPERLSRHDRLSRKSQIQRVYRKGKRFKGCFFTIMVLPGEDNQTRLGHTVKKTVNGVVRNRIRRRLKEVFRTHRSLLPERPVWLHVHYHADEMDYASIHDHYVDLLKEVRIWCGSLP